MDSNPCRYLKSSVIALALIYSNSQAALPIILDKPHLPLVTKEFQLLDNKTLTNKQVINGLQWLSKHKDNRHIYHNRIQQIFKGFPVYQGYIIIHSKNSTVNLADNIIPATGYLYLKLEHDLGEMPANFVDNAQSALNQFTKNYKDKVEEAAVKPMIYIDTDYKAHWAYKVSATVNPKEAIPKKPVAIVDAKTHQSFIQWDDIKTVSNRTFVKAQGFGGNTKIGRYEYGKDYPLLTITRDNALSQCYMENRQVKVVDMHHTFGNNNKTMQFRCAIPENESASVYHTGYQGNGLDEINGASSPSNDALYAGQIIKDLYTNWYHLEALTKPNGTPMKLIMRVHYGSYYSNAYWDGKQMTFGDGEDIIYPLVSLSIGSHEISHGFTEQHSDLEYHGQSGAINEAFSDMAAQAAEFYANHKNNWMIGAEVMKEGSGYEALRFMDTPSRDGRSIESASQYYQGIDVHYASGVYNRLFYLIATSFGWDVHKAFDIMVKANMDYWTPYTNYLSGACGILQATDDLKYDKQAVKDALMKVEIDYSQCGV